VRRVRAILGRLTRLLLTGALGFVVGGILIYVLGLRSGLDLEIWHRVDLESEFTAAAAAAGEVATFEAYRRLEDELFAELDERVYERVAEEMGSGPELALARYSAGSLADPNTHPKNWNRSYELEVSDPVGGVLLLHGMSDSPYSLRAFAESFRRRGLWVVGLRLPGHGTAPSGLTRVRWEDMAAAVRLGMEHLEARVGEAPLHVVGYSTGAPLALDWLLEQPSGGRLPTSLVLVSPSIGITRCPVWANWPGTPSGPSSIPTSTTPSLPTPANRCTASRARWPVVSRREPPRGRSTTSRRRWCCCRQSTPPCRLAR
jgi:pimeloyl-ACP methyl ester carboxylesterase